MSDIEFLKRKLDNIGEQRRSKISVAISEVSSGFAKSGRAGSGAHSFRERETIKEQFDECVKEMAAFYVGFCEQERLPLKRHLNRLAEAGSQIADEWSAMAQNPPECSKALLTMVDDIVWNAVRGYVGREHLCEKPPSMFGAVLAWASKSTTGIVTAVVTGLLLAFLVGYFHLK